MTVVVPRQAPYRAVLSSIIFISELDTIPLPSGHRLVGCARNASLRIIEPRVGGPALDHFHAIVGLGEIVPVIQIVPCPASYQPDVGPIKDPPAVSVLVLVGQLVFTAFPEMIG